MVGYNVVDKYKNRFIANFDEESLVLQLGSSRIQPCVTLRLEEEYTGEKIVILQDYMWDILCSEDNLPKGKTGTRSMLYCALNMMKSIFPEIETFTLQDEATIDKTNTSLSSVYLLTRGKSYYHQVFPDLRLVRPRLQIEYERMINIVNSYVNKDYVEIMGKCFNVKESQLNDDRLTYFKRAFGECYKKKPWCVFFKMISDEFDIEFWEKYLIRIEDFMDVSLPRGAVWNGNMGSVSDVIIKIKSADVSFDQNGGRRLKKKKVTNWGDMYFDTFNEDCVNILD